MWLRVGIKWGDVGARMVVWGRERERDREREAVATIPPKNIRKY
jgi:hypothetical protein